MNNSKDNDDQFSSIVAQIIPSDFDVDLIYKAKNTALFAAKRKFHWHFVRATSENINGHINNGHL